MKCQVPNWFFIFAIVLKSSTARRNRAPSFMNSWEWEIVENAPVGSRPRFRSYPNDPVVLRAYMHGQQSPIFKVEEDARKSYFSVEAETGIVKLRQTIDREAAERSGSDAGIDAVEPASLHVIQTSYICYMKGLINNYSLRFSVGNGVKKDYGIARVTIIDVNDNNPLFRKIRYEANIREDARINEEVLQVIADDPDLEMAGEVFYTMPQQNLIPFRISRTSGKIFLSENIDYEITRQYRFLVIARDGDIMRSLSSNVSVTVNIVDVQDSSPQFVNLPYDTRINEDLPSGSLVATVTAVDGDRGQPHPISYTFAREFDFNKFLLESSTGKIRVGRKIDRDILGFNGVFVLKVKATELLPNGRRGGAYNVTTFRIFVDDVNDNRPRFDRKLYHLNVSESTPVSATLPLRIRVSDADQASNSDVIMTLGWHSNGLFAISPVTFRQSAVVSLILIKPLDFETKRSHRIEIFANETSNPHLYSKCVVHIDVLNENDNAPVFDTVHYRVNVSEDSPLNQTIFRVHADDGDDGEYGSVKYLIQAANGKMAINQTSGELHLVQKLDYEQTKLFECTVTAKDNGLPSLYATAFVTLYVSDVNDNFPIFVKIPQNVSIRENTKTKELAVIKALDADSFPYNVVTYTIETALYNDYFAIHTDTDGSVIISVEKALDYERIEEGAVQITIRASDSGHLSTTTLLVVHVDDENDNRPEFVRINNITVKENIAGETPVTRITATDADSGNNAVVRYYVTSGQALFATVFDLNERTGIIATKPGKSPDHEVTSRFDFVVMAQDRGLPSLKTLQPMSIVIEDVNDNIPIFSKSLYRIVIEENSSLKNFCVPAKDADAGDHALINYSICAGNTENLFRINQTNGCLTNKKNIDHEKISGKVILEVQAKDKGSGLKTFTKVVVNIIDLNDNSPVFRQTNPATIEIAENTLAPSLGRFVADDPDKENNGKIRYSIKNGNDLGRFRYSPLEGELQVAPGVMLDREDIEIYNLTLLAADEGSPSRFDESVVRIRVVDSNDNSPEFVDLPPVLRVFENRVNTSVCHVTARDRDAGEFGRVTYSIEDSSKAFFINPKTGVLDLVRALDREERSEFNLTVLANDNPSNQRLSRTSRALILVIVGDENDEKPKFESSSPYRAIVKEGEPKGRPLIFTSKTPAATDADLEENSKVIYSIEGMGSSYFSVDSDSGSLYTATVLDRESLSSDVIDVILRARDVGGLFSDAVVKVTVVDVNDNPPEFKEKRVRVNVFENALPGHVIVRLIASDPDTGPNGEIFFRIIKGSFGKFAINKTTGDIYLAPGEHLDRETKSTYQLKIAASDKGIPRILTSTAHVDVVVDDVNDCRPKFMSTRHVVTIMENLAFGSSIATLSATDPDLDSRLVFQRIAITIYGPDERLLLVNSSIAEAMTSDFNFILRWFNLNPETGEIAVSANKRNTIDREEASSVHLLFRVRDVNSDVEEFASSLDVMMLQINIEDQNDNWPTFDILTNNAIRVNNTVTVDVFEETEIDTILLTILAQDNDQGMNGRVTFQLFGEVGGYVKLVEKQSRAHILVASRCDREELAPTGGFAWINFTLLGYDHGLVSLRSSQLTVQLRINDVNDNSPKFLQQDYKTSVFEDALVGTLVLTVFATDRDIGQAGNITYKMLNGSENFSVNQNSGEIVIAKPLDREKVQSYLLQVIATDCENCGGMHKKATTQVSIRVLDVNDNAPVFIQPLETSLSISEDTAPGTAITKVTAQDPDLGAYGRVSYSLQSDPGCFTVDQLSGDVIVTPFLATSRRHPPFELLNISVSDGGGLKSSISLKIQIDDVNNNRPVFIQPTSNVIRIPEEQSAGYFVTQANATDDDLGLNGMVRFELDQSNRAAANAFCIDDVSGKIVTSRRLDREILSVYTLRIEAFDLGYPQHRSVKTITIHLTDVNDNPPLFPQNTEKGAFQRVKVFENAVPGTIIDRLTSAIDRDLRPSIYYHVISENGHLNRRTFDLDGNSLILRKQLDRETLNNYTLIIGATNQKKIGYPFTGNHVNRNTLVSRSGQSEMRFGYDPKDFLLDPAADHSLIRVTVKVRDVIDEPPNFSRHHYVTAIKSGVGPYTRVIQVSAIDLDFDDVIVFSIPKSNKIEADNTSSSRNDFVINPETGLISTATRIVGRDSYYNLTVQATDMNNYTDIATVIISIVRQSQLFHLFINSPPDVVKEKQDDLRKLLEDLLGSFVVVDEVNNFRTFEGLLDVTRSDVTARLFNRAYDESEIEQMLKGGESKLKEMFKSHSFYEIIGDVRRATGGRAARLRVAVVALSLFVTLLSLVFVIVFAHTRNRYKKQIEDLKRNAIHGDDAHMTSASDDDWQQRVLLFPNKETSGSVEIEKKLFKAEVVSSAACAPVAASTLLWSPSSPRKARETLTSSAEDMTESRILSESSIALHAADSSRKSLTPLHAPGSPDSL